MERQISEIVTNAGMKAVGAHEQDAIEHDAQQHGRRRNDRQMDDECRGRTANWMLYLAGQAAQVGD